MDAPDSRNMELTIAGVDYAPEDLYGQVPLVVELLREIPGDDRPDYWLGALKKPVRWLKDNCEREISHLVLAARWEGTRIERGARNLPVGIAFVTDPSLLDDKRLDFRKCAYVAIGISDDTSQGPAGPLTNILSGNIGRAFGAGKPVKKVSLLKRLLSRRRSGP